MGADSAHKQLKALVSALDKSDHKTRLPVPKKLPSGSLPRCAISSHKWSTLSPMIASLVDDMKSSKWKPCPEFLSSLNDLARSAMLEELFINDSLFDLQANSDLYVPAIRFLCVLINNDSTRPVIFTTALNASISRIRQLYDEQSSSKFGKVLQDSSELLASFGELWALTDAHPSPVSAGDIDSSKGTPTPILKDDSSPLTAPRSSRSKSKSSSLIKGLFFGRKKPKSAETSPHAHQGAAASRPAEEPPQSAAMDVDPPANDPASRYISELRELQFGEADLRSDHSYASRPASNSPATIKRISHELVSLAKDLPLHPKSSIFVRYDPERIDLLRALVTGPEGTPYEHGCLVFDIYLPPTFPDDPPQVLFITGARAHVRFNPNLYDNGYVCLSVINTWSGSGAEKWNGQSSTLLQVLVSLQALVLCPDPYFNEPGYELLRKNADAIASSKTYSNTVAGYTLAYGIRQWLTYAPVNDFDRISRIHLQYMRPKALFVKSDFDFATGVLAVPRSA